MIVRVSSNLPVFLSNGLKGAELLSQVDCRPGPNYFSHERQILAIELTRDGNAIIQCRLSYLDYLRIGRGR